MVFNAITATCVDVINSNIFNDMAVINKYFMKSDFSKKNVVQCGLHLNMENSYIKT